MVHIRGAVFGGFSVSIITSQLDLYQVDRCTGSTTTKQSCLCPIEAGYVCEFIAASLGVSIQPSRLSLAGALHRSPQRYFSKPLGL